MSPTKLHDYVMLDDSDKPREVEISHSFFKPAGECGV